tara:strand:- start:793 stop:1161 length:369 start_codon:yes stop_codon:yes gene_type:complete
MFIKRNKNFVFILFFFYSLNLYAHEKKYILGVSVGNITKSVMEKLEIKDKSGAIILKLFDPSPAKKSGLLVGDIILKIDDQNIDNYHDLINFISIYEGNGNIDIITLRNKKKINIPVNLEEK